MIRTNEKEAIVSYEDSIKKSNTLALAKMNQGLTLNQMQLLAFAIYNTQQNGSTVFRKADMEKRFGMSKYLTEQAKSDAEKLSRLQFSDANLEQDEFSYSNAFQRIRYTNGTFEVTWSDFMLPHILDLKEKHILTDLSVTSNFKSAFSWVLYDYLKANYGHWNKTLSKEAAARLFGVEGKKTYATASQLRRTVIDKAIEEINEHTELLVSCKNVKEGRNIVAFKLSWSVGKVVSGATNKQLELIRDTIAEIVKNQFIYTDVEDIEDERTAMTLIREVRKYVREVDLGAEITTERADFLIKRVTYILNELEEILKRDKEPNRPKLYNWLEERD